MLQFMKYDDDFYDHMRRDNRKLVIYGAGDAAQIVYPFLENVSYVCDRKADGTLKFHDLTVIPPENLDGLSEKVIILICAKNENVRSQIKENLKRYNVDAKVFELYDNVSFNCFHKVSSICNGKKVNYVRLICRDDGWIFTKFAQKMQEHLELKGVKAVIGECADINADINHYIAYAQYEPLRDTHDTLMITHIDSVNKMNLLKHQLTVARMGICMSRDTMNYLTNCGLPRERLCYINPAQDGMMKIKKYVIGITHRTYDRMDHRKRAGALIDICRALDPAFFYFKIMGAGWNKIVEQMRAMGFEVDYYPDFDYQTYTKLMTSLDYFLYWGFDEGSMGYLDALAAGVETIVTPQGYHLDIQDGITHSGRVIQDFVNILMELQNRRKKRVQSVEGLTWDSYVDKHLAVWNYLLGNEDMAYESQHMYEDGIFSVLRFDA